MYTALYRAYRPETFEQLLGQEHIVRILKNQIAQGTTSHAYLFCGTRGTGKTTTARLLAKGLNCLSEGERPCGKCSACQAIRDGGFLDVVEIDAASNRGIDDIKALRDTVNYPPVMGRKKIYIIDEVHMLTTEAFNALLKTLEEPPEYVTFILATTEVQKLPATILSRCIRLDFKRIPEKTIIEGMRRICADIGIRVTDPALRIIAANADGSVRDGLSILDQCIAGGAQTVDAPDVLDFLGASGEEVFADLTDLVCKRRTADAIEYLAQVLADGKDVRQLIRDWINHYRNLMITKYIRDPGEAIDLSVENIDRIRSQSAIMEPEDINRGIMELSKTMNEAKWSTQPRILLELCIVNLCQGAGSIRHAGPPHLQPAGALKKPAGAPEKPAGALERSAGAPEKPAGALEQSAGAPEEPAGALKKPAETPEEPMEVPERPDADAAVQNTREEQDADAPREDADEAGTEVPAAEMQEAAPAASSQDLRDLWDGVFSDGAHSKGSMYLIRSNSMLTELTDHTFTVAVSGDLNRRHTENNRKLLEDLMEQRTGVRRGMRIVDGNAVKKEITVEDAAANAAAILGTDVEIT